MIAPLRPPAQTSNESQQRMRLARRVVAHSLLPRPSSYPPVRPVARWKAAVLVTWMAVAAGCYVARLLNLWE